MSSAIEVKKMNWECKECGVFHWGIARKPTPKDLKKALKVLEGLK
jgi:hypothetical protein